MLCNLKIARERETSYLPNIESNEKANELAKEVIGLDVTMDPPVPFIEVKHVYGRLLFRQNKQRSVDWRTLCNIRVYSYKALTSVN